MSLPLSNNLEDCYLSAYLAKTILSAEGVYGLVIYFIIKFIGVKAIIDPTYDTKYREPINTKGKRNASEKYRGSLILKDYFSS